jgi:hypothetical protein
MALKDELFDIEQGFWLSGKEHFLEHVDTECLLRFLRWVRCTASFPASASQPQQRHPTGGATYG